MKDDAIKKTLKKARSFCMFWIARPTSVHLEAVRLEELEVAHDYLPSEGRLLEIGAGTGWQAQALQDRGYDVSAIDIALSNLRNKRIWPVTDYDGMKIPFKDNTFDIIFSSNVLEHIPHIFEFQKEMQRVLKPEGIAVHILPSSSWRFWSNMTEMLKNWRLPLVHGEHAGNSFVEIYYFSRWSWSRLFRKTDWTIETLKSVGLFYTGSSIMDSRLSINTRRKLSWVIGSACNIFVLKKCG
ncbi:MAG: class I SAM-dependent methyltransferase [Piscirickettsiaceae bacterium]|jgi:2-polyprenyl-3-methyl-5-hydroxy-6-metoxy-1,4-benzoquinol methylase|nr:class I SAM-dependent methyltransferase [Piscirickettsiaceae bacterium]